MFKQLKDETANSREMITSFLGYNHNLIQNAGEFWDTENISLRNYPVLSPRSLADNYKLSQLKDDYTIDNVVKEKDFDKAFNCEKSVVQKGEGKAPVVFDEGVSLKGKFPQRYQFFTNYGKIDGKGMLFTHCINSSQKEKIQIRGNYNNECSIVKSGNNDLCFVQTGIKNYYMSEKYATFEIENQKYIKTQDRQPIEGKNYYELTSAYGAYNKVNSPSSTYQLYEAVSAEPLELDLLKNTNQKYTSKNNIITSININKLHIKKKLKQFENKDITKDEAIAFAKKYNIYNPRSSNAIQQNGGGMWNYLYGYNNYDSSGDFRLETVAQTILKNGYIEYSDEPDNVTVKASVDILLTFRLNNKDNLCKVKNKSTGEEKIAYRGATVTATVTKNVTCTAKLILANDTICEKDGMGSELVNNYIVTTNRKYNGDNDYNAGFYWFEWSQDDMQQFIDENKSTIEKDFAEELFHTLDEQNVLSQLEQKAINELTENELKISSYYEYAPFINPTQEPKDISVILKNGSVSWSNGKYISYKGVAYSINQATEQKSAVQLLSMDTKILEFPNNVMLDTAALEKGVQPLGVSINLANGVDGNKPYAVMCDRDGTVLDKVYVGKTEPENTETYKYWVDISQETPYVKVFSTPQGMWVNYNTVYCRLYGVDINSIKKGDTVHITLEGKKIDGFDDEYYYIYDTKDDENYKGSVIISQLIPEKKELSQDVVIAREIPDLDFVTVAGNRVWGCRYGKNKEGKQVNQIYASALGDPTNWFTFQNTSEDSYFLTLGDDTEFTGATAVNGYPYFFKENGIYEIYGSYPAAYQLITYEQQGCEVGSNKSIAVVDGDIFFKSPTGICVFSNGVVTSINRPLGVEPYHNAIGGGTCGEYYVNMLDKSGNPATFVFDVNYSLWIKLNEERYKQFCTNKSGLILAIKDDNSITSFGRTLNNTEGTEDYIPETTFDWSAETGQIDYLYPDHKYISNIIIRAIVESDAVLDVYIQYNSDGNWLHCGTLRGNGTPQSSTLNIIPQRCDHYAYKFIGSYGASVISVANEIEQTGD